MYSEIKGKRINKIIALAFILFGEIIKLKNIKLQLKFTNVEKRLLRVFSFIR